MRLDKYIASCTGMSRNEIRKKLKKQPALIDGAAITAPETQIDENADVIFSGTHLSYRKYLYILMNKPAGTVCSNREGSSPTVFSLLHDDGTIPDLSGHTLFTIGRLDKDTTGLLLLTDDGDLSHRMLSPRRHVDKTYRLTTDRPIPADAEARCGAGLDIGDDKPTKPGVLTVAPDRTAAKLTIHEGRFHQVKRMMHAIGCEVVTLQRISMGPFVLDPALPEGGYRTFTPEELAEVTNIRKTPDT